MSLYLVSFRLGVLSESLSVVTIESFAKILGEVTLMRPGFGKPPIDILKITEGEITRG